MSTTQEGTVRIIRKRHRILKKGTLEVTSVCYQPIIISILLEIVIIIINTINGIRKK